MQALDWTVPAGNAAIWLAGLSTAAQATKSQIHKGKRDATTAEEEEIVNLE